MGLTANDVQDNEKVIRANRHVEIAIWLAEQALCCTHHQVGVLLVFPEDFGGHVLDGPASMCDFQEVRSLEQYKEVHRCAVFSCRFANSGFKRPLGILSNFTLFVKWVTQGGRS